MGEDRPNRKIEFFNVIAAGNDLATAADRQTRAILRNIGADIEDRVDFQRDDPAIGADLAAELCLALQAEGVDEFHFYTLNRAELVAAICQRIQAT